MAEKLSKKLTNGKISTGRRAGRNLKCDALRKVDSLCGEFRGKGQHEGEDDARPRRESPNRSRPRKLHTPTSTTPVRLEFGLSMTIQRKDCRTAPYLSLYCPRAFIFWTTVAPPPRPFCLIAGKTGTGNLRSVELRLPRLARWPF